MTTRSVFDTLRHADGTPWQGATVTFTLTKGSYTGGAAYPPDTVVVTTDEGGGYSATLWCDEEGVKATRYQVTHPNGESFKIDLPVGDGSTVAMSALRAAAPAASVANLQTLLDGHTSASDPHPQYLTEVEGDAQYEPSLGNPAANGYVLSSTTLGVRSWVAIGGGGGGGAVDSVNGETGVVELTAADVGADVAGTAASAVAAHEADTTSVHGITDTAALVLTSDSRLSDSRPPIAHASSHAAAGSDALTLSQGQITNLVSDLANKQPLDSDLTAIAALSTTAFGRALLELADAPALRTAAGLGSLAVLSAVTASLISDASANGRSLITAADYAAMRTLLGLVIGTDVQAYDAELAALAGLTSAANKIPYFTGSGSAALADLTAFARTLLDDANAATARATLGVGDTIAEGRPAAAGVTSYSIPGVEIASLTTDAPSANQIRYMPILVATPITVDQIALEVSTAGAGGASARMAIYSADTDWQPTTLVVDSGAVGVDTTGVKAAAISATLPPARYLLAVHLSAAGVSLRSARGGTRYSQFRSALGSTAFTAILFVNTPFGPFNATGTPWTSANANTAPLLYYAFLRVSTP